MSHGREQRGETREKRAGGEATVQRGQLGDATLDPVTAAGVHQPAVLATHQETRLTGDREPPGCEAPAPGCVDHEVGGGRVGLGHDPDDAWHPPFAVDLQPGDLHS